MKKPKHKKVLGLALGERSLLVAELASGDRLTLVRTGELVYPADATPSNPAACASSATGQQAL